MASESPRSMIEGRSWKGWLIGLVVVAVGAVSLRMARDDAQRERRMRPSPQPISNEMAETLNEATVADGRYRNHYFQFSLPIPKGWSVLTQEQIDEVERRGASIFDAAAKSRPSLRGENPYARTLFIARSDGNLANPGSALMAFVEVKQPGTTVDDYLRHADWLLEGAGENIVKVGKSTDFELRGRKFKVLEIQTANMSRPACFYVTIERDYVLNIATAAFGPEAAQQLKDVVSAIEFTGAP